MNSQHVRKTYEKQRFEGLGVGGEFPIEAVRSLRSTTIEWPKYEESQRKNKDSEGPGGGREFQLKLSEA